MGDFFVGFQSSKFCNVAITFFLFLAKQKDPKHITLVGELLHRSSKRQAQTIFVKIAWPLATLIAFCLRLCSCKGPTGWMRAVPQSCGAGSTNTGRAPGGRTSCSEPPLTVCLGHSRPLSSCCTQAGALGFSPLLLQELLSPGPSLLMVTFGLQMRRLSILTGSAEEDRSAPQGLEEDGL